MSRSAVSTGMPVVGDQVGLHQAAVRAGPGRSTTSLAGVDAGPVEYVGSWDLAAAGRGPIRDFRALEARHSSCKLLDLAPLLLVPWLSGSGSLPQQADNG